ncbi:MAG TPA: DUF72 domain-containing protein [Patescibacteria group bacterium]|nr:DUF72 domain-containing protein [Patescibacteria group bacterium]
MSEAPGPAAIAPRPRIGASSWSAPSWEGVFYPPGTPPARFIEFYARRFDTVEIDATFYRIPAARTVDGWRDKTPPGFLFAAKVPQTITHEKLLEDCRDEMLEFVRVMDRLGERLGPLLLQFRYFRKEEMPDPGPFLDRLERFLPILPSGLRFAVEVRNRAFLTDRLFGMLRRHGVALAFIDHPWFARVDEVMRRPAARTAGFCYVRWLGDRHGIEKRTTAWDRIIVDRAAETRRWIGAIRTLLAEERTVYGYFNNHYAGYAVGSIELFRDLWEKTAGAV